MCGSCSSSLDRLFARGVLHTTGVGGLYARNGYFESVISCLDTLISRPGADSGAEAMRLPSAMGRAHFEKSGYMNLFPQLFPRFTASPAMNAISLRCYTKFTTGRHGRAGRPRLTSAACYQL